MWLNSQNAKLCVCMSNHYFQPLQKESLTFCAHQLLFMLALCSPASHSAPNFHILSTNNFNIWVESTLIKLHILNYTSYKMLMVIIQPIKLGWKEIIFYCQDPGKSEVKTTQYSIATISVIWEQSFQLLNHKSPQNVPDKWTSVLDIYRHVRRY